MGRCEMLKLSRNKAECDPSGMWGCPKHKNRDMITPECWRLRRFEGKKAIDQTVKERIYRNTILHCPKCRNKFQAKEGL